VNDRKRKARATGRWLAVTTIRLPAPALAQEMAAAAGDFGGLSIEQLANLEVTSVSRRAEPLREAPAAVYVITHEDIERSGALSLPEALRLAPNLQVARVDAGGYGITANGFNHSSATANKLQVLIDGRSVYTPLFSGVFWDEQNVLLDDVDRIEVISGPGGTLWGANAVNGVINVITRSAHETAGGSLTVGGGSYDQDIALRYGVRLGDNGALKVYGLGSRNGPSESASGADARDKNDNTQFGFRGDWDTASSTITFQGDYYHGDGERPLGVATAPKISGGNLLGRWTRRFGDDSNLMVQAYYDRTERFTSSRIQAVVDTYAVDAQYNFALGRRHSFVVGGGYRLTDDEFLHPPGTSFLDPAERKLDLWQAFGQDTISLADDLDLIAGLKIERNDYTGVEYMPNLVLSWRATEKATLWASASRAVRTPSRFDRDLINPGLIAGGPNFQSEYLTAYEIGYRGTPSSAFSLSVSAFYNDYDELRTLEGTTPVNFPLVIANGMHGKTYGVQAWGALAVSDAWRLSAGYSKLDKELALDPGSRDVFGVQFAGNDPDSQFSVRSSTNFGRHVEMDLALRGVGALPSPAVPSYVEVDARLGLRLTDALALSVSGYNLADKRHLEFAGTSAPRTYIPRSFYVSTRWRF
jgi:iron complex outermembrane receptor protein